MQDVLDPVSQQTSQLQRKRHYNDTLQHYDYQIPPNCPEWACNRNQMANVVYDTKVEQSEGEIEESSYLSSLETTISHDTE